MHRYLEASQIFIGRTASRFEKVGDDRIEVTLDDGKSYAFLHNQDCCESVSIHDIQGDLTALVGSPFTEAKHESESGWPSDVEKPRYEPESFTWTILTFSTTKGNAVIRWLGQSNGYYGEGVSLEEIS